MKTIHRLRLLITGMIWSIVFGLCADAQTIDTLTATFAASDQVNVTGAGSPSAPTYLGYHKDNATLPGDPEIGLVGNSGGTNARHNGNVVMGFALPDLTGPIEEVTYSVTQTGGASNPGWYVQLYAFAPEINPRAVADGSANAYTTLHFSNSGTDASTSVRPITGTLMTRVSSTPQPSATVNLNLTALFQPGGLLADFYDDEGKPVSKDAMIWFRLSQGAVPAADTSRIVVNNSKSQPTSPSLIFKTTHTPATTDFAYPESWAAADAADTRVATAHQNYIAALNRQIDRQRKTQLPLITSAHDGGAALSAGAIHYAHALAYRASLAKTATPLAGAALETYTDFVTNGKKTLVAVANAVASAAPGVAAAQAVELAAAQGSLVRLYRLLADDSVNGINALTPAEKTTFCTALATAAQAVLANAPAASASAACASAADGLAATAALLPGDANAAAWLAYANNTWATWKQIADTTDDARGANGLWLHATILQASELGATHTGELAEPAVKDAFDRFAHMVSPNGTLPDYGATLWDEGLGHWLHVFEKLGRLHARADFLENAAMIAAYLTAQPKLAVSDIDGLVAACRAVEAVAPPAPADRMQAIVTTRMTAAGADPVFDKLHLRTGHTTADSFASFDLYNQGGLGHEDAGALTLYTSGTKVLLHALGGANNQPNRQQGVWAMPASETANFLTTTDSPGAATSTTTDAYAEPDASAPKGGLTRTMQDSSGRSITHHRDARLRLADNALFVLDTFEFAAAGDYTVGPVWHAQEIVAQDTAHIVVRDNVQIDSDGSKAANAPGAVRFDFAVSGTAAGETLVITSASGSPGRHPQANHFAAINTGARTAGKIVTILSVLRPGEPAAPTTVEMLDRYAKYTDATSTIVVGMNPYPTIENFTPVEITIGGTVAITGENFDKVDAVLFGNVTAPAGTWAAVSKSRINAIVPGGIPANGYITLTSLTFPDNAATSATEYTMAAPPGNLAALDSTTNITAGKTLTLAASASGNPAPVLQWQVSTDGGATWSDIPGATDIMLTVNSVTADMTGRQYRYTATNHAGGATSTATTLNVLKAWLGSPSAIAIDAAGNLYVTDSGEHVIRSITASGVLNIFTGQANTPGTASGAKASSLTTAPAGISIAPDKTLRFTDGTQRVRIAREDGSTEAFVGSSNNTGLVDNYRTAARFNGPVGIVTDSRGNSYVADSLNHAIRRVSVDSYNGGTVVTIAGTGTAGSLDGNGTAASFNTPCGLALDEANQLLYVADTGNHTIRTIDLSSSTQRVRLYAGLAGESGLADGPLPDARFNSPRGMVFDGGDLYVVDTDNGTIRHIASDHVTTIAGAPGKHGFVDATGTAARFNHPREIAMDAQGNLYVADTDNGVVRKIAPDDTVTILALSDYYTPEPPPSSPTNGGGAPSWIYLIALAALAAIGARDRLK